MEQALHWMVTLQSGTSSAAEQVACQAWREADARHELAWQRLAALGQGMRESTAMLPASGTRRLLQARSAPSRRTVLKGFAGLGVLAATGWSVQEQALLPPLFSDYRTTTGERRQLRLGDGLMLQLDTRTALDVRPDGLMLSRGRVLLETGAAMPSVLFTAHGRVVLPPLSRLIARHGIDRQPGTVVQLLQGSATVESIQGAKQSLLAGQQVLFDSRGIGQPQALTASVDAWTQGLLIAERMPLGEVVAELDRYRRGVLRCDPAVASLLVSGSFSLDRPDASLDLLARTLPIRVQRVLGYWASVQEA